MDRLLYMHGLNDGEPKLYFTPFPLTTKEEIKETSMVLT